jgi:hypothetical protein
MAMEYTKNSTKLAAVLFSIHSAKTIHWIQAILMATILSQSILTLLSMQWSSGLQIRLVVNPRNQFQWAIGVKALSPSLKRPVTMRPRLTITEEVSLMTIPMVVSFGLSGQTRHRQRHRVRRAIVTKMAALQILHLAVRMVHAIVTAMKIVARRIHHLVVQTVAAILDPATTN